MYTIEIPQSGWTQDRITGQGDWRHDLGCPCVVVKQTIKDDARLSVQLVKTQNGVEIRDATIEEWQAEPEAPRGGFWAEGRAVPHSDIRLVR